MTASNSTHSINEFQGGVGASLCGFQFEIETKIVRASNLEP